MTRLLAAVVVAVLAPGCGGEPRVNTSRDLPVALCAEARKFLLALADCMASRRTELMDAVPPIGTTNISYFQNRCDLDEEFDVRAIIRAELATAYETDDLLTNPPASSGDWLDRHEDILRRGAEKLANGEATPLCGR